MIFNPHKTSFIIFEGGDGSGKSSQFKLLQNFLTTCRPDYKVAYTKEPDIRRPVGKKIYDILDGKDKDYKHEEIEPFLLQAFYIEDRMQNYRDNIIPGLQNGYHVIQDRGPASSICYGSDKPSQFSSFMGLHDRVFSAAQVPFFWADLTLIFDVPAEIAVERMNERMKESGREADAFEQLEKLKVVRENYRHFARKYPNCVLIDGLPDEQTIFLRVLSHLLSWRTFNNRVEPIGLPQASLGPFFSK